MRITFWIGSNSRGPSESITFLLTTDEREFEIEHLEVHAVHVEIRSEY